MTVEGLKDGDATFVSFSLSLGRLAIEGGGADGEGEI